jgi:hypothetical protein
MRLATPPWIAFTLPLRSYITLLILASFVSADGTVTLYSLPGYTSQRACAQLCFYGCNYCGEGPWTAGLIGAVGCAQPFLDSCMCRTDLFPSASGYLSTCVSSACSSDSVDVNSALSIYGSYCAQVNSPATNVATTTPNAGSTPAQGTTTVYVTVYRSSATSSDGLAPSTAVKLWGLLSFVLVHISDVPCAGPCPCLYSFNIRLFIRAVSTNTFLLQILIL